MSDPIDLFRAAIHAELGYSPDTIRPGVFQRFPTSEKRSDTSGWAKLFDDHRGGVYGCYRQGLSAKWFAADPRHMSIEERNAMQRHIDAAARERFAAQRQQWEANAARIAVLWDRCKPLSIGDPVVKYLAQRGIGGIRPACLRLHPSLDYWHAGQKLDSCPAMVAAVTDAAGRIVALHRTYLTSDGRKADVPTAKKLTGAAGPLAGASIKLCAPAAHIGVAEGIETALAAFLGSGVPTWAAYCAHNLSTFRAPAGTAVLTIFADNDPAGRSAADALKARGEQSGLRVKVLTPSSAGDDWCDVFAREMEVAL